MKQILFLLGLSLCLSSCNDKEPEASYYPGRKGSLVATMSRSQDGVTSTTTYSYDGDGRVVGLKKEDTHWTETHRISYTGEMVEIETFSKLYHDSHPGTTEHTTLWLNAQGRMVAGREDFVQTLVIPANPPQYKYIPGIEETTVVYNPNGQLVSFSGHSQASNFHTYTDLAYVWSNNLPTSCTYKHSMDDGIFENGAGTPTYLSPVFSGYENTTNFDFLEMSNNLYMQLGLLGNTCPFVPQSADYLYGEPGDAESESVKISYATERDTQGRIIRVTETRAPQDIEPTIWEFTYH